MDEQPNYCGCAGAVMAIVLMVLFWVAVGALALALL